MSQGIIFTLHGRRNKITPANIDLVLKIGAAQDLPFALGFLEGECQTLEDALVDLRQVGVSQFICVPVLLFAATHVLEDIPLRLQKSLTIAETSQVLPPLGTTRAMMTYLKAELAEIIKENPNDVVLIAHGTPHYSEPGEQLVAIAKTLTESLGRKVTALEYLGEPNYQAFLVNHHEGLIIKRLFLTEGFLANKIKQKCQEIHPYQDLFLATLENTSVITNAINERLAEVNVSDFS